MMITYRRSGRTSCRGGALLKLLVFLIIFAGVITAAWIILLPPILTSTIRKRTGFDAKVERFVLNPFTSRVELTGFLVTNPAGFPRKEFVEIRSFSADADLMTLFSHRLIIERARVHVANMGVIRNGSGTLNRTLFYDRLFPVKTKPKDPADARNAKKGPAEKKPEPVERAIPEVFIKELEVQIDSCVVADYARPAPFIRRYDLAFKESYRDVLNTKQLLRPLAARGLSSVGLALQALIPGDLGKSFAAIIEGSEATKDKDPKKAPDPLKTIVDSLEQNNKP